MEKKKVDLRLMEAVIRMVLKGPEFPREDVARVTVLDNFGYVLYRKFPSWAEEGPGDFSLIGEMPKLHTLHFVGFRGAVPDDRLNIRDFSFLKSCSMLKRLDLRYTNFTDCALLLELPALKYVFLPPREELEHLEALDRLPKSVKVSFLDRTPWTPPAPTPPPVVAPPPRKTPEGSDKVKAIVEELKRRTAMDCWKLTIQPDSAPGILDSKIGGLPYWPPAMDYPTDAKGEKLHLLAQINFDQLHADAPLPQGGMLQFFIGQDGPFGADFDDPTEQNGFRVVYHETIDPAVTQEQVRALDIPAHDDVELSPVFREAALSAEKTTGFMSTEDARFDPLFSQVVKELTGDEPKTAYGYLSKEDWEYLFDQFYTTGHRMLGYPYFTQYDPREPDSPYDTLLLQLDSDGVGRKDYVLWGDCGVGSFFIPRDKLERGDFTDVLYTWDCC